MIRKLIAEALGSAYLLAAIIGAGIMASRVAPGDGGPLLIGSTLAIGAILVVIITLFGPVSGAHFNPVVSLVMRLRGQITTAECLTYIPVQIVFGILGTVTANLMFDLAPMAAAEVRRAGPGMMLSELVATYGLLLTVLGGIRVRPDAVPALVGLYITAGIWFTASTSFANPAVAIARAFSNTPAGISPQDVVPFILCQIIGALAGHMTARYLWPEDGTAQG